MGLRADFAKVLAFSIACFALAGGNAFSDNINGKLDRLTSTEKISVVLCARGAISINYRDTVAQNLKVGGSDATWALKVSAAETAQMSELAKAANWADMETYYKAEADAIARLIQGRISFDDYKHLSQKNSLNLKTILDFELMRQEAHKKNFQKLDSVCKDISSTIIAKAKVVASK
jgi:hypothetical protein